MAHASESLSKLRVHDDVLIPVGSETVAATRHEPTDIKGPLPAILMAIPYRKDDRITFGAYNPSLHYLAKHGYEVVTVDLPGTGASSGTKQEPFNSHEGDDLVEIIHWLSKQDWCDGNVGMFGKSYGGWTQLKAAEKQPEPLKAIAPVSIVSSGYESSNPGGVFNLLKRGMWGSQMHASKALPPSRRDPEGRWAEVWHQRLDDLANNEPWLFQFLSHEEQDDFWTDKQIDVDKIKTPTLAVCGYRDIHTRSMVEYFEQIDAPKRFLLGPWRHIMPHRGREVKIDFRRQALDWFDYFLKGRDNGALDHPEISYWTERDGGWQIDGGVWRTTDTWPTVTNGQTNISLSLSPDGLVKTNSYGEGRVEDEYEYDHTVGVNSLERVGHITSGPVDTSPDDTRSLVFETEQLQDPIELTGTGEVKLRIQATTTDPIVAVRINDVDTDGTARPVTSGYLRASHRNGHKEPTVLTPGEEYEISVPLKPRSHVFESGHKIRVAVSSAYFPRTLPTREHGSFTLLSTPDDPSVLTFPGKKQPKEFEFGETVSMNPPDEEHINTISSNIVDSKSDLEVSRNHATDTVEFNTHQYYTLDLPHDVELVWQHDVKAKVKADDPNSAYTENAVDLLLVYDTEEIEVNTRSRVSRNMASISTEVTIDEQVVFDEIWRNDGPR